MRHFGTRGQVTVLHLVRASSELELINEIGRKELKSLETFLCLDLKFLNLLK